MTTTIIAPCVVEDMPDDVYHADPWPVSLSSTMAKTLLEPGGARTVRWRMSNPQPRKKAWDLGTAAHSQILGRGKPLKAISGNRTTKAVKEAVAEAEAEGFLVVRPEEHEGTCRMAESILSHPLAAELLTHGRGKPEVSLFDIDPVTGIRRRGRLDFLHSRQLIVDLKTSANPAPSPFSRDSHRYGYAIQAAHYIDMAVNLGIVDEDVEYYLIAVGKEGPFHVSVNRFTSRNLDYARDRLATAYATWDECLTLDEWPGIDPIVYDLDLPNYA